MGSVVRAREWMQKHSVLRPLVQSQRQGCSGGRVFLQQPQYQLEYVEGQPQEAETQFVGPIKADTCISLIKVCSTLGSLRRVHASMVRFHLHLNLFFSTNLIARYASLGSIAYASNLFSIASHADSDVFLWNVMIRVLVDNALYHSSLTLYKQMTQLAIQPDNFTFPFVLKACASLRQLQLALQLHAHVLKLSYHSDVTVANSLLTMYAKCGHYHIARHIFDNMHHKNVVSWSSIIGAYAQNGCSEEGLFLFSQMLDDRIRPNRAAILNAMACVQTENEAHVLSQLMMETGFDLDKSVQNAAMRMYARSGRIDVARRFFDGIIDKDLVSWASMIESYAQADMPLKSLELFRQMATQTIRPDLVILLALVSACINLASLQQARFLHGFVIRSYFQNHVSLETALVDLYGKCSSLEYARKVFDRMQERNVITWSTMISGYGIYGHAREALHLFDQMKTFIKPDHVTFVSVLSACSHGGLIQEGWNCFNSMSRDFGLTPSSQHYACMVDLLGRAGRLHEAREFIEKMPLKPDAGVWGALLSASRIHLNVEMAELAAKILFELDSNNPGRYVLLSNIYVSSGKRIEADKIRAQMKQRGLRKIAGHTIIEINNKIHTFVAGDRSHPEADLIYSGLKKMIDRIRQEGYTPDLNLVLHDIEEETKEMVLYVHSEKLAIVYGLLSLRPESIIRIKKNLRVCADCHVATKYITKVTGREIVVRDAHRFHHFKDGICSCGDYW